MRFDAADPAYQDLLAEVLRTDGAVVPFVGAGLSLYGSPDERLPSWDELLDRLIEEGQSLGTISATASEEIDEVLRCSRYIDAMDILYDELGEPTFRRVVEEALDDAGKPVPPAIAELVSVDWPLIVTTNLDRLIARAYLDRRRRPLTAITGRETRRFARAVGGSTRSAETVLAQIHGSVDVYESWLLTGEQYSRLLADPGYVIALQALFFRTLFFVGFGLRDDDFDRVLETIAAVYPAGAGDFYALVPRSKQRTPAFLELERRAGFRPIFYDVGNGEDPSDPHGGHGAVCECLAHLAAQWATARSDLNITLKYLPELDPSIADRPHEIERLAELTRLGAQVCQVVGLGGLGKTSLVLKFLQDRRAEIAAGGYEDVFACSFYRADISQFVQDMAVATAGPSAGTIPGQVDRVCGHVTRHRTLLVLDGLEAILDEEGVLGSAYVLQIVEAVLTGRGTVLITSRIPANGGVLRHAQLIDVEPLSPGQIDEFLRGWGLGRLGDGAAKRLGEVTGGHPLALRVLAGVLKDVPSTKAIATIERSAVIDRADEVDPLRENRLARIIGSYFHHLGEDEIAFLSCLTAFEKPAPFMLINSAFTSAYSETDVNGPLVGRDLRPLIARLLERRLLTASATGEISCHPTVREYFAGHVDRATGSLAPIHGYLATETLRDATQEPDTFAEATPLIDACRHAAACGDWSLFDDLFRNRLMRGFRDHLCDTLGAWDEALGLASLGDGPNAPAQLAGPGYYPIIVARCLKHLGRTAESRAKYALTLEQIAPTRDPYTAMYVNNFLTLLIWRGELDGAERLLELNVRAFSWIEERWMRRWQVEHGFSSIAYLKLLQGQLSLAEALFDRSDQAWEEFVTERPWPRVYDYYSLSRSELTLLFDPDAHERVLAEIGALMAPADLHLWPESLCRGYIHAAGVHVDRGRREGDQTEIAKGAECLERARSSAAGMNVADVAVAHRLGRLKVELARHQVDSEMDMGIDEMTDLVDRIAVLVSASGLALAAPEVTAARGALCLIDGSRAQAGRLHERAVEQCRLQGNALAPHSPRALVGWLGSCLERDCDLEPSGSTADVSGLVGSQLRSERMVELLKRLPPSSA